MRLASLFAFALSLCLPAASSLTRTRREEQAARRAILGQAAADRSLKKGKPLPVNRLLAGYGRREHPISDQMAVHHPMDEGSG